MTEEFEWLSLGKNESIIWSGKPRLIHPLKVGLGAAIFSLIVFANEPLGGALVGLAGVALVAYHYLRVRNIAYALTNTTLYRREGIGGESVNKLPLGNIQNTDLDKGVIGTQLGFGTVRASTAGASNDVTISYVDDPETLRDHIDEQRSRYRSDTGVTGSVGGREGEAIANLARETRALREAAESLAEVVA